MTRWTRARIVTAAPGRSALTVLVCLALIAGACSNNQPDAKGACPSSSSPMSDSGPSHAHVSGWTSTSQTLLPDGS